MTEAEQLDALRGGIRVAGWLAADDRVREDGRAVWLVKCRHGGRMVAARHARRTTAWQSAATIVAALTAAQTLDRETTHMRQPLDA